MLNSMAREIYEFIKDEASHGLTPSIRDICSSLNIKSTSTVHRYLQELEEEGLIDRTNNRRHAITLTGERKTDVPILGAVAAGQPITATESVEGYIAYSGYSGSPHDLFALNVKGDSMIDGGILDGDIVVVRKTPVARNGQLVVAMVDGEATVKRFYKEDGRFRLQPENSEMQPMYFKEVAILGIVIANIRRYE